MKIMKIQRGKVILSWVQIVLLKIGGCSCTDANQDPV